MTDTRGNAGLSRRSFMRKGAVGGTAAAAAALAAPAVLAQAPLVMKMQTSWPASDIWMDMAREYTTRVEEMSAGRMQDRSAARRRGRRRLPGDGRRP